MYTAEGTRIYTVQDQQPGERVEELLKDVPENYQYTGFDLNVRFNQRTFPLPIVTINPGEQPKKHISIAWFYPLRQDMAEAAAQDMTVLALSLIEKDDQSKPVWLYGPPTEKSRFLNELTEANLKARIGRQVDLLMFPGGLFEPAGDKRQVLLPLIPDQPPTAVFPDRQTGIFRTLGHREQKIIGVCYQPVTGKNKFLYLDEFQIRRLREFTQSGGRIILVEDVVSTGATIKAMRRMLTDFCGVNTRDLYTVAAAYEGNQSCSDPTVKYVIQLPEWIGQF